MCIRDRTVLKAIEELEKNKKSSVITKEDMHKKLIATIRQSLDILEDPNCSESLKNITLRSFVRQIVYAKKTQSIEILYQVDVYKRQE